MDENRVDETVSWRHGRMDIVNTISSITASTSIPDAFLVTELNGVRQDERSCADTFPSARNRSGPVS